MAVRGIQSQEVSGLAFERHGRHLLRVRLAILTEQQFAFRALKIKDTFQAMAGGDTLAIKRKVRCVLQVELGVLERYWLTPL